jgi:hypothetical protein
MAALFSEVVEPSDLNSSPMEEYFLPPHIALQELLAYVANIC